MRGGEEKKDKSDSRASMTSSIVVVTAVLKVWPAWGMKGQAEGDGNAMDLSEDDLEKPELDYQWVIKVTTIDTRFPFKACTCNLEAFWCVCACVYV